LMKLVVNPPFLLINRLLELVMHVTGKSAEKESEEMR